MNDKLERLRNLAAEEHEKLREAIEEAERQRPLVELAHRAARGETISPWEWIAAIAASRKA